MNLKLPATHCLVCEDLREGDGQTISEKPLTCLALHIKSCKEKKTPNSSFEVFSKLRLKNTEEGTERCYL